MTEPRISSRWDDDPDGFPYAPHSALVTLHNGPCAGAVVEVLSDCQQVWVPHGDGCEIYEVDIDGTWWHASAKRGAA